MTINCLETRVTLEEKNNLKLFMHLPNGYYQLHEYNNGVNIVSRT